MIPDIDWTPQASDIAWQQNMVDLLREDAAWAVPATQSVFKVSKKNKTFKLIAGDPNEDTNRKIAKVFKIIGYTEIAGEQLVIDVDSTEPLPEEGND